MLYYYAMNTRLKYYFGTAWLLLVINACSYDVRVNERLVYSPTPLLSADKVSDKHLRNCLQQTIEDLQARSSEELIALNCSNAAIASLQGLEKFTAIEVLNLKNNHIKELLPLASLSRLRKLHIDSNQIESLAPLGLLDTITELSLEHNPALTCDSIRSIRSVFINALIKEPQHCQAGGKGL